MNKTSNNALKDYYEIINYLKLVVGSPYYPESLLPANKQELKQWLEQERQSNPQDDQVLNELIADLDHFIPYSQAIKLAKDYQQVERKHNGLEYKPEVVRRYWKTLHKLYGVDERLEE